MASYLELNVGRYNRLLQKLFGIKTPIRPTAVPEVGQFVPLFHGAENRYLEGWERFAHAIAFSAAGVGNVNQFRLRNPAASNVIAVIEKIAVSSAATAISSRMGLTQTAGDLAGVLFLAAPRLDPRGRPTSALIISNAQAVSNLPGNLKWIGSAPISTTVDAILFEDQELPLLPGDAIHVEDITVNIASNIGFVWRERFLEDSERS